MATIYLIRHGQASFGADDYDQLSPVGLRQAALLGEYLRDCAVEFDASYSGSLLRQRQTAERVLACQPVPALHSIDPRFNEIDNEAHVQHLLPRLLKSDPAVRQLVERGLDSSKQYQKLLEVLFRYWVSPECDSDAVQSWQAYSGAVRQALVDLMHAQGPGKTVAVFSSGGTIATLVGQVLGLSGAQTYPLFESMFNCSVTQLFYSGEKVSLSCFNDRSFLQLLGAQRGEDLVTYR